MVDALTRAMTRLADNRASLVICDDGTEGFVDYQTRMVECSKTIARISGEIASKAAGDTSKVAGLTAELSHAYARLATDTIGAAAAATNGEVAMRLKVYFLNLFHSEYTVWNTLPISKKHLFLKKKTTLFDF